MDLFTMVRSVILHMVEVVAKDVTLVDGGARRGRAVAEDLRLRW